MATLIFWSIDKGKSSLMKTSLQCYFPTIYWTLRLIFFFYSETKIFAGSVLHYSHQNMFNPSHFRRCVPKARWKTSIDQLNMFVNRQITQETTQNSEVHWFGFNKLMWQSLLFSKGLLKLILSRYSPQNISQPQMTKLWLITRTFSKGKPKDTTSQFSVHKCNTEVLQNSTPSF